MAILAAIIILSILTLVYQVTEKSREKDLGKDYRKKKDSEDN